MILKILDIISESDFALQFLKATIKPAPIGGLCVLGNQYIIGSILSSYLIFR